jgi:hypothetical protein
MDDPIIRWSARKHGVSDARILAVIANPALVLAHPERDEQLLLIGFDAHGVPLEVVAIEDHRGALTIIHAMRLRSGYRRILERRLP